MGKTEELNKDTFTDTLDGHLETRQRMKNAWHTYELSACNTNDQFIHDKYAICTKWLCYIGYNKFECQSTVDGWKLSIFHKEFIKS